MPAVERPLAQGSPDRGDWRSGNPPVKGTSRVAEIAENKFYVARGSARAGGSRIAETLVRRPPAPGQGYRSATPVVSNRAPSTSLGAGSVPGVRHFLRSPLRAAGVGNRTPSKLEHRPRLLREMRKMETPALERASSSAKALAKIARIPGNFFADETVHRLTALRRPTRRPCSPSVGRIGR
jgi:hypothetical protein